MDRKTYVEGAAAAFDAHQTMRRAEQAVCKAREQVRLAEAEYGEALEAYNRSMDKQRETLKLAAVEAVKAPQEVEREAATA
jgi:hypothetical protein